MSTFFSWSRATAAALACWCAAAPAHAQDEDAQLWTATTANFDLGNDTTFSAQVVARFSDAAEGLSELQLQGDFEKEVRDGLSVGAGYSYVPRYDLGRLTSREHRTRQQVSTRLGEVLGGQVEGRVRLEQRWRDDGEDLMLRLRLRLMWTRKIGPEDLSVRLSHESFAQLNDTDWGGEARYSRMRNQVSLRRKFGEVLTGELGYLNQYSLSGSGSDELVHALTVATTFDF
jgi:hypothetical protein